MSHCQLNMRPNGPSFPSLYITSCKIGHMGECTFAECQLLPSFTTGTYCSDFLGGSCLSVCFGFLGGCLYCTCRYVQDVVSFFNELSRHRHHNNNPSTFHQPKQNKKKKTSPDPNAILICTREDLVPARDNLIEDLIKDRQD